MKARYRVQLRRGDGWQVKPGAEQIDGKAFDMQPGWPLAEEGSSLYAGEWAMMFCDPSVHARHPDAPAWIASGDLALQENN